MLTSVLWNGASVCSWSRCDVDSAMFGSSGISFGKRSVNVCFRVLGRNFALGYCIRVWDDGTAHL